MIENIQHDYFIWEEKNSIEVKKNCSKCNVLDQKDITKIIKIDLMKNQCKDIGKISGIYKIIHKKSGKYYVGSSMNINIGTNSRLNTHLRYLKSNRHRNDYLQNAWNKYGKTAFEFKIVEKL